MFCPHCGKEVSEGQEFCHHCGSRLGGGITVPSSVPDATNVGGAREKTPWEDRETIGFFNGLFRTLGSVLFHPSDFYKKMTVTGGLTDPLLFALIIGMVGFICSTFWRVIIQHSLQNIMPLLQKGAGHNLFQGMGLAALAFVSPFLIIIAVFISSGILHVCLMMVGGTKNGFEATFRVITFGYAADIFMAIPACGGLLWMFWTLVLFIIGLKEAHETSGGRAAFAVFLPLVVCCGLGILLAAFMGFAAVSMSSLMQMQQ